MYTFSHSLHLLLMYPSKLANLISSFKTRTEKISVMQRELLNGSYEIKTNKILTSHKLEFRLFQIKFGQFFQSEKLD